MLLLKVLVCTDGSNLSKKAVERAAQIAGGCSADEVAVIHVYDHRQDLSSFAVDGNFSVEDVENFKRMVEQHQEERKKVLLEALKVFEDKNIKARAIFKIGHPAKTIINVAEEEGFDLVVIGSRGLSGLQKIFLGSVSGAVVQQIKNCDVLTVK